MTRSGDRGAETAQVALKRVLRDTIAPLLRAEGFRGSGQSFLRSDDWCWSCVGFQRSTSSNAHLLHLTVNLGLVDKQGYAEDRIEFPHLPERPPASGMMRSRFWHARLGYLVPPSILLSFETPDPHGISQFGRSRPSRPADRWWALTTEIADEVAEHVAGLLVNHGLPALEAERASAERSR